VQTICRWLNRVDAPVCLRVVSCGRHDVSAIAGDADFPARRSSLRVKTMRAYFT
jgi:hypothetical protein